LRGRRRRNGRIRRGRFCIQNLRHFLLEKVEAAGEILGAVLAAKNRVDEPHLLFQFGDAALQVKRALGLSVCEERKCSEQTAVQNSVLHHRVRL